MKKILNHLFEHKNLTRLEAKQVLIDIGNGAFNEHELSAFMTVYLMRSITMPELLGFRDALLDLCVPVDMEDRPVMDIVGTGGDGKNTFNISTLSCFIVAGAGQPVAKHGSYGASSISGASNLMDFIGYKFKNDQNTLRKEIDETNMCFLHAPIFHPALKIVAPIRKNLRVRTFFNMLGPMVNPANPTYQLVGVYNLEMARIYNYLLQSFGKKFMIINSLDGYDEISLTSDAKIITEKGEKVMSPFQMAKRSIDPKEIYGGDSVEEAASNFLKILKGEGTVAQNAVVTANAAMALHMTGKYTDYEAAFDAAEESLISGKANNTLQKLLSIQ
jgi:anthranilate phosphoribosyltransferase